VRSALWITASGVAARGVHLLLFLWIGNRFGAGGTTDEVFFLQAPLLVLVGIAASTAQLLVMPAMHRAEAAGAGSAMRRGLRRYGLLAIAPLGLLALAATAWATGYGDPVVLAILAPAPAFGLLGAVETGLLNARGRHVAAALGPAYGAAAGALGLALLPVSGRALAAVLLLFEVGRWAGLALSARPLHAAADAARALPRQILAWAARGAWLQALAVSLVAVNPLVDALFARQLATGSVTLIEYGGRLWNAVPLLLSGHMMLFHERLSRASSRGAASDGGLHRSAAAMGAVGVALALVAIAVVPFAVEIVYSLGRLGDEERAILARLLQAYLLGAGPFVAGVAYTRAMTARGRSREVVAAVTVGLVANVVFNALFIARWGVVGIALSTSLAYLLNTLVLAALAARRGGGRAA
jgi:putative peptidoglycan lipid II flippase